MSVETNQIDQIPIVDPSLAEHGPNGWLQVAVQPEGADDDTWSGVASRGEGDDFDPEMFSRAGKKPTKPPASNDWMHVAVQPEGADDDTWSGGSSWDVE